MKAKRQSGTTKPTTSQNGRRPTLGFLVPDFFLGHYSLVLSGITAAARKYDANIIVFPGQRLRTCDGVHGAPANVIYDLVSPERIDGLFMWSVALGAYVNDAEIAEFCTRFQPLPVLSGDKAIEGIPSILKDDASGMRQVLDHLVRHHGYHRIALIRGPKGHRTSDSLYQAYVDILSEFDLFNPDLVSPPIKYWNIDQGIAMVNQLLDEQGLRPQIDFEAIVTTESMLAIGAMKALQTRGIAVPGDVVVTGYTDYGGYPEAVAPPLTTVRFPFYQMGYQAVEMLLARLRGEEVPERVMLPAKLIVRQSCGCLNPAVTQAAVDPATVTDESSDVRLTARREAILSEMLQAMQPSSHGEITEHVENVLDGFLAEVTDASSGVFLRTLSMTLNQVAEREGNIALWQYVISALRCHVLPVLENKALVRAENLWQQARIIIGETAERRQIYQKLQVKEQARVLREIAAMLITTFDVRGLMDVLADKLPQLGISSCYLSLYEDPQPYTYPQPAPEWLRLMLAYTAKERFPIDSDGQRFPSKLVVPEEMLPQGQRYTLIIEPLYFGEAQLGFTVFQMGAREESVYEVLRGQISSALEGALLVQRVQERSAEIARQKYILDTFMANVPDSIYFKDRDSRFIRVNQAVATLLGVNDPAHLVGKSDFDFFPDAEARPKYKQEQEIMQTGNVINLEEPDAQGRWALTTKMPLRDEHGEIIGTFGISRDITALKKAQEAVVQHAHELAAAYEEIRILNDQLKEENVRMGAELDVARRLQTMILPAPEELQAIEGLEIVGYMQPADEVGGDYYDVLDDKGTIHIGIGDVTGHGLESGVLMLMTQTAIRTLIEHGETDPVAFVNTLNRTIYKNAQRMNADKTLTFALVNYQDGLLKIVGQHEEILVVRHGGQVERMDTVNLGFPIGLEEEITQWVAAATVTLQPGDSVVLYTDGITEAANMADELYGVERLCEIISRNWDKSAEKIKQVVTDDVIRFIGDQKVFDDLTLLVLKQK